MMTTADHAFLDLDAVRRSGQRAVLATVVAAVGPAYRRPGASAVIVEDGRVIGAISGGCLESDMVELARSVFADGRPRILDYDTAGEQDLLWGTGTGCGGRVQVLVAPVPALAIVAELVACRSGRQVSPGLAARQPG